MNKWDEIIRDFQAKGVRVDEAAMLAEINSDVKGKSSLAIKILSIAGGFLATLLFIAFLLFAGLYESPVGLMVLGILFIVGAVIVSKTHHVLIIDTASISVFVIGFSLIGLSLGQQHMDETSICMLFIFMASVTLFIVRTYFLSFISVIIINGSFLAITIFNDAHNMVHLHIFLLVLLFSFMMLREAKLISYKNIAAIYNPVRSGILICLLILFFFLGERNLVEIPGDQYWLSSPAIMLVVLYLISLLLPMLNVTTVKDKTFIYMVSIIILSLTAMSPAISGSILIILLCFKVNYKTGFSLGVISFVYFISRFYYDLNLTLLVKSVILMSTGFLFILFYFFTSKKLSANENV